MTAEELALRIEAQAALVDRADQSAELDRIAEAVRALAPELEELHAMKARAEGLTDAVGPVMRRTAAYILTGTWPETGRRG